MQELKINTGGRPRRVDDLKAIQDQLNNLQALYGIGGSYVITGCSVSGSDIAAGYVFIDGKVLKFDAVSGVSFPYFIKAAAPVDAVTDVSALSGVQTTQVLYKADGTTSVPSASYIAISSTGGRSLRDALNINTKAEKSYVDTQDTALGALITALTTAVSAKASQADLNTLTTDVATKQKNLPVGTQLQIKSSFLSSFAPSTGLGTGVWVGWALCDGRNSTDDLRSFFLVGYDSGKSTTPTNAGPLFFNYGAPGNTGGEDSHTLSVSEMPSHNHTNGAYDRILKLDNNAGGSVANVDSGPTPEPSVTTSSVMQATGGGGAHENRPRYKVALWVEKVA